MSNYLISLFTSQFLDKRKALPNLIYISVCILFSNPCFAEVFEFTFLNQTRVLVHVKGSRPEMGSETNFISGLKNNTNSTLESSYGQTTVISREILDAILLPMDSPLVEDPINIPKGIHFIQTNNDSQLLEGDYIFLVKHHEDGFRLNLVTISGRIFEIEIPSKVAQLKDTGSYEFHHMFEELVKEVTFSEVFTYKNEKVILISLRTTLGAYTFIARDTTVPRTYVSKIKTPNFFLHSEKFFGNLRLLDRTEVERSVDRLDFYVGKTILSLSLNEIYKRLLGMPVERSAQLKLLEDSERAPTDLALESNPLDPSPKIESAPKDLPDQEISAVEAQAASQKVFLEEYAFQNDANGLWLVRKKDNRQVHLSPQVTRLPVVFSIEDQLLSIHGARRKVDLRQVEIESSVLISPSKETATSDGLKDPKQVVQSFFTQIFPNKQEGKFSFSQGDQELVKSMLKTFRKPADRSRSLVLLGEAGTGKSVLLVELMRQLPRSWQFYQMDALSLDAGSKYKGVHEERVKALVELSKQEPVVLLVDEFHTLVGSGTHEGKSSDVLDQLKSAMAEGRLMIAATDTHDEYHEHITDPALLRRLTQFELLPPKPEELKAKLEFTLKRLEMTLESSAVLDYLLRKSSEFFPHGHEPDRSQRLIDQIMINKENWFDPITKEDVNLSIRDLTRRDPAEWTLEGIRSKLKEFPSRYRRLIAGDSELVDLFVELTAQSLLGLVRSEEGPALKMLLAGAHGVGKSSRGEAYAKAMGYESLVIEMNRYRPGSGLFSEQFMSEIAQQLLKDPHSVIILDELEKCSIEVQQSFLRMLENDYFTAKVRTSSGQYRSRKISVRFAKFIATTNAGHQFLEKVFRREAGAMGFVDSSAKKTSNMESYDADNAFSKVDRGEFRRILREHIEPAVVNRFSGWYGIYIIPTPSPRILKKILLLNLSSQLKYLKNSLTFDVDFQISGVSHLVDKHVKQIAAGQTEVRDAIKNLLFEVRQILSKALLDPGSGARENDSNSPTPRVLIKNSFAPPRCAIVFRLK